MFQREDNMLRTIVIVTDEETAFTVDCRIATESEIAMWQQQKDERTLVSMMRDLYSPKDVYESAPVIESAPQPSWITAPSSDPQGLVGEILREIRTLPTMKKKVYIPAKLKDLLYKYLKPTYTNPYVNINVEPGGYRLLPLAMPSKKTHTDMTTLQRKVRGESITFEFQKYPNFPKALFTNNSIFIPFV